MWDKYFVPIVLPQSSKYFINLDWLAKSSYFRLQGRLSVKAHKSYFIMAHFIFVGYGVSLKVVPLTHLQSSDGLKERGVCL